MFDQGCGKEGRATRCSIARVNLAFEIQLRADANPHLEREPDKGQSSETSRDHCGTDSRRDLRPVTRSSALNMGERPRSGTRRARAAPRPALHASVD